MRNIFKYFKNRFNNDHLQNGGKLAKVRVSFSEGNGMRNLLGEGGEFSRNDESGPACSPGLTVTTSMYTLLRRWTGNRPGDY